MYQSTQLVLERQRAMVEAIYVLSGNVSSTTVYLTDNNAVNWRGGGIYSCVTWAVFYLSVTAIVQDNTARVCWWRDLCVAQVNVSVSHTVLIANRQNSANHGGGIYVVRLVA